MLTRSRANGQVAQRQLTAAESEAERAATEEKARRDAEERANTEREVIPCPTGTPRAPRTHRPRSRSAHSTASHAHSDDRTAPAARLGRGLRLKDPTAFPVWPLLLPPPLSPPPSPQHLDSLNLPRLWRYCFLRRRRNWISPTERRCQCPDSDHDARAGSPDLKGLRRPAWQWPPECASELRPWVPSAPCPSGTIANLRVRRSGTRAWTCSIRACTGNSSALLGVLPTPPPQPPRQNS